MTVLNYVQETVYCTISNTYLTKSIINVQCIDIIDQKDNLLFINELSRIDDRIIYIKFNEKIIGVYYHDIPVEDFNDFVEYAKDYDYLIRLMISDLCTTTFIGKSIMIMFK